jgi:dCMP deaminase
MKDWDKTFIEIAEKFAEQSTCVKRKVGAVLVKDLRILSTGYNGTPSGFCNCNEVFKEGSLEVSNVTIHTTTFNHITHHDFAERYEIHAEQNCLSFAAKNGVSTDGCTLYVTTAPCVHCAKIIIASGIKCVIYKEIYKNDFGIKLLEEAGVLVISVESVVRAKEYNVF